MSIPGPGLRLEPGACACRPGAGGLGCLRHAAWGRARAGRQAGPGPAGARGVARSGLRMRMMVVLMFRMMMLIMVMVMSMPL